MKTARVVLGLLCGILGSSSALADCHDAKHSRATPARYCAALIDLYAKAWTDGAFESQLTEDVQLTVEQSPSEAIIGKENVLKRFRADLKTLNGSATYTVSRRDGGHLKVGGFLGLFGKTELENMAELRWRGRIAAKGSTTPRFEERVTAILLRTGRYSEQPWQFVALHIRRRDLQPSRQ